MNKNQLLFSKTATARILNISFCEIDTIQVWADTIWVKLHNKKPQLISKKVYLNHFVKYRQNSSINLVAIKDKPSTFQVLNPQKNSWNTVDLFDDKIKCSCEDYQNQIKFLQHGCCKHGYKVLSQIGCNSLSEYITKVKLSKIGIPA